MSQGQQPQSKIINHQSSIDAPWTVGRLLQWTTQFLAKKGFVKAERDTSILLAHALGCKRIEIYTRFEEEAPTNSRDTFRELIKRCGEGCPIAYLIGRKGFFSLDLEVTPAVLIPREDSEWIVTEFLRLAKGMGKPRVLDVGTGSGCLALAAAKQHLTARLTATDLSPEALAVASRNAARHGLANRVAFLEGDLFAPLPDGATFDFILSNPPYIAHDELARLEPGVRDFEPHLALDGGPDGFAVLDRLFDQARQYLEPGGHLLVEIGWDQEARAREKIERLGGYELGKTVQDVAGHPRVIVARRTA